MQKDEQAPVAVFDLDGTILRINSFPAWVLFLICGRVAGLDMRARIALSLASQWHLVCRKSGLIDHDTFLRRLQLAWRIAGAPAPERFAAKLMRHARPNLVPVLERAATGRLDAILATAAAEDYAAGLGRRLGFRHVLATAGGRAAGEPGNAGERKRDQVLSLLQRNGWRDRPLVLATDHIDDLPLMRQCDLVLWYGPHAGLHGAASEAAAPRILLCRNLDAAAVLAALDALSLRPAQGAAARASTLA